MNFVVVIYKILGYNRKNDTKQKRLRGVFMEKVIYPTVQIAQDNEFQAIHSTDQGITDKEKKSLILLSPILLGAAVYAGSISIMIAGNIFKILF